MKAKLQMEIIWLALYGAAYASVCAGGMSHASAADASHPYSNVNRSVDAGNDTGDNRTDQLNQQQLDKTGPGSNYGQGADQGQYGRPPDSDGARQSVQRGYVYNRAYPYPSPPYPPYLYSSPPVYVGPFGLPYGWAPWWRSPRYRANFYPYLYPY